MSLRLDMSTIAKIEADRIYDLILPETEGKETVTVPSRTWRTFRRPGRSCNVSHPPTSRALEKLSGTAKVHRFRRKAVIPKESLARRPRFARRRSRRRGGHRERDAGAIIAEPN